MKWSFLTMAPRATLAALFFSNAAFGLAPPEIKDGDDLSSTLSQYALTSQNALTAQGKAYRLAAATAPISGSPGTSTYIVSLNAAYQQALANAYEQMTQTLGDANIRSLTTVQTNNLTGSAQDAISDCQMNKSAETEEQQGFGEKALALIERFLDDKESKPERSVSCELITDQRAIEDSITSTLADVFEGSRVAQTVVHDGEIGVVIALSPETAAVAGVLASQRRAAAPLPSAGTEIMDWVTQQTAQQPGNLMGLVGSRMFKLSNGEWAVVGFGVAPADNGGLSGAMGKQKLSAQRKTAAIDAQRELARFANTSISAHTEKTTVDKQMGTARAVEFEGNESIETLIQRSTYSRLKAYSETSSKLRLKGSTQVYSQKLTDPLSGADFFLIAHAWSPSLMSNATDFRQRSDEQYSRAKSGGNLPGQQQTQSGSHPSSVPLIEQDW